MMKLATTQLTNCNHDENIMARDNPVDQKKLLGHFNRFSRIIDDVVLGTVALGTIIMAILLLIELGTDFMAQSQHSFPHITSDLMFVLIMMELFRQVVLQINKEPFSLNPFIFIGVIASIRGILIMQMRLSLEQVQWQEGTIGILAYALIVLILFACYHLYNRTGRDSAP